ncbi:MAG: Ankyrin repeat-containing protein [Modestobacter sp.]|nr:Ankyrin repeat-containing protein [Modestobacter sp.]
MTTRMTAQRLARLIAAGDADPVQNAVTAQPRLLTATVEHFGQSGWTPLHLAVAAGNADLVEQLVAAGADLAARTEGGRSPLHVALEHAPDLVALLRRLGAPVDAASAAFLGDVDQLSSALDAGAPLTDRATDVDLLNWAAAGGAVGTVQLLLDRGADPGQGSLHAAAAAAAAPVVALLLRAGADVDGRDPDTGRTPLHTAVAALGSRPGEDVTAVVTLLLDTGADVDATTNDGASALDIARVGGARRRAETGGAGPAAAAHDALSRLLVAAGATG